MQLRIGTLLCGFLVAWLMASCGGGGVGGTTSSPSTPQFSATFNTGQLAFTSVAGNAGTGDISASINYTGTGNIYLLLAEDSAQPIISSGSTTGGEQSFGANLIFKRDLAVGRYATTLVLHACNDEKCASEVSGSPVRVSVSLNVTPNLSVEPVLNLSRTGRERLAPVNVPVTIPPLAQSKNISFSLLEGSSAALQLSYVDRQIVVACNDVRAGNYVARARLTDVETGLYHADFMVRYTVHPPPTGELPLRISAQPAPLYLHQGQRQVFDFHVQRPTWTSDFQKPDETLLPAWLELTDLGNDNYRATVNTQNLGSDHYWASIIFSAFPGATEEQGVHFQLTVDGALILPDPMQAQLDVNSTDLSVLTQSTAVIAADGSAAHWSASADAPWLILDRSSGVTGVDRLVARVDASQLATLQHHVATITVSSDLPGTLPQKVTFGVSNSLPRIAGALVKQLAPGSARLYLQAPIAWGQAALYQAHMRLENGSLRALATACDWRYAGNVCVLRVDVDGLVAGQNLVVHLDTKLLNTSVSVPVRARRPWPVHFAALPFGKYRPAQWAAGRDSVYFAGLGQFNAWTRVGDSLALRHVTVNLTSPIDAAISFDEQWLFNAIDSSVFAYDPADMSPLGSQGIHSDRYFDDVGITSLNKLVSTADGRMVAAMTNFGATSLQRSAALVASADFANGVTLAEPGPGDRVDDGKNGVGLVRSPNGQTVIAVYPNGMLQSYTSESRVWTRLSTQMPDLGLVAVTDNGRIFLRNNGNIYIDGTVAPTSLNAILPSSHHMAGYALSPDGQYALVYGYQVSANSASDAKVWVVDIRGLPSAMPDASNVLATLSLPSPVGCITTLQTDEACLHQANITVSPDGASAVILGPRGIASIGLPVSVSEMLAKPLSGRARTTFSPVKLKARVRQ